MFVPESFPHREYVPALKEVSQLSASEEKGENMGLLESFLDSSPKPHREEDVWDGRRAPSGTVPALLLEQLFLG